MLGRHWLNLCRRQRCPRTNPDITNHMSNVGVFNLNLNQYQLFLALARFDLYVAN